MINWPKDFDDGHIGLNDMSAFKVPARYINERLSTDLVAFKIIINCLDLPLVEGYAAFRVLTRMVQSESPASSGGALMMTEQCKKMLTAYEAGNCAVAERYCKKPGLALFAPAEDSDAIATVVALSVDRGLEIYMRYKRKMSRSGVRVEIFLRNLMRGLLPQVSWLEKGLGGVCHLVNKRRLRREWNGQR